MSSVLGKLAEKPSRGRIFVFSLIAGGSVVSVLAAVVQTMTDLDFQAYRDSLSTFLGTTTGFWIFVFLAVAIFAAMVLTLTYYTTPLRGVGTLFSNDGVLQFDREEHIAFSVQTVKRLLAALASEAPQGRAEEAVFASGVVGGHRFGTAFKTIYQEQVVPHGARPWAQLDDHGKLDAWEVYDATGGFGRIRADKWTKERVIEISIRHPSLFEDDGGRTMAWMLAGYCQAVISALLLVEASLDRKMGIVHDRGAIRMRFGY